MTASTRKNMAAIIFRESGKDCKQIRQISIQELSITLDSVKGLAWIDMQNPGTKEREWLLAQGFHEMAVEDCFKEPVPKA